MTTKEPLASPADASGKKLLSFANEMTPWTLEAMGFNVVILPLPEVYLAIQEGGGQRPEERDRHHPCEQILGGRAERHADVPSLQLDAADDVREEVAEALRRRPGGGDDGRRRVGHLEPQCDPQQ